MKQLILCVVLAVLMGGCKKADESAPEPVFLAKSRQIKRGMTRDQVKAIMGRKPDSVIRTVPDNPSEEWSEDYPHLRMSKMSLHVLYTKEAVDYVTFTDSKTLLMPSYLLRK